MPRTKNPQTPPPVGTADTSDTGGSYGAEDLVWLEGLDGVRKRVAMYIGSSDSRGLTHCLFELFDNAVDEALGGHASTIVVTAHTDGSFSVTDNGRGIPVAVEPRSGLSGVVLVMTKLHAGGKFGGDGYKVSGGLHGVGASVVNALSSRLDVTVARDRARWAMSFRRGEPGRFAADGPDAAFTPTDTPWKTAKATAKQTGTTVRFWPDPQIFQPGSEVNWDAVRERCRTTAHLVAGVSVDVVDERSGMSETHHAPGGVAEFVRDLAGDGASPVWKCSGVRTFVENAQVVGADGQLHVAEVERHIEVEVALSWTSGFDGTVRSFVNVVATPNGGTHVAGFERAVTKAVQKAVSGTKLLRAGEEAPVRDDVLEGLVAVVSVNVPEPEFEGQTKESLATAAVTKAVAEVVADGLAPLFGAPRLRPAVRAVCEKVVAAGRARRAARDRRDTVRRQKAISSGPMPAKLRDCRIHDERAELLIVEGDSAAGSIASARDSAFQAYLPLRGKILNAYRATDRAIMDNEECAAVIAAVGTGVGAAFDLDRLRYRGGVAICADADSDGKHIAVLTAGLCFAAMRPLLAAGKVYVVQAPLYRISLADGTHMYCYDDGERDRTLADLRRRNVKVRDGIQRFKGLGEMSPAEIGETVLDPATRRWKRLTMNDAARAAAMVELLLGEEVSARREWLLTKAGVADLDTLDV
jgi:DNA gyrase subunit B